MLFRNSYEASLKPSYVMYIWKDKLDSVVEKENIELIKRQMKESGLDVPLIIFDRYSIREKIRNNQLEQNQDNDVGMDKINWWYNERGKLNENRNRFRWSSYR